jgi:hypothetical protein
VVPLRCGGHRLDQHPPALALAALPSVVVAEGDPGTTGEVLDRTDEVEVQHLPHERDGVALRLAPEAVVEAELVVHRERAGPLVVERAQPDPPRARPPEGHVVAHDGEEAGLRTDPLDVVVGDAHARPTVHATPPRGARLSGVGRSGLRDGGRGSRTGDRDPVRGTQET